MSNAKIITAILFAAVLPYSVFSQDEKFISLNVQPALKQAVIIEWRVMPLFDTLSFEVQRSRDTIRWETISRSGTLSSHQYFVTDSNPGKGVIYYRIRQIDATGKAFYSGIKWLQISKTGELYIWPNPAQDVLHLKTPFSYGTIEIINEEGQPIQKVSINNLVTNVTLAGLPTGIYFMRVKHDKEIFVEKFVKGGNLKTN